MSSSLSATSPFWTDGKRNLLEVVNAGQVYFFDSPVYDER